MSESITQETAMIGPVEDAFKENKPHESKVRRVLYGARLSVEATTAFVVISPLNEVVRLAASAAVLAATGDAYLGAATFGASTFATEGLAAVVTPDIIDTRNGKKFVNKLNNGLERVGVTKDTKANPVTKAGISYLAGSGVAILVEHREDPSRTKSQNRRYGLKNATALGAVCTVQGFLVSEGIANPDPLSIGGAVVGIGSVIGISKWAKSKIKKSNKEGDK